VDPERSFAEFRVNNLDDGIGDGETDGSANDRQANLAEMFPTISGNGGYPLQPFSWTALRRVHHRA